MSSRLPEIDLSSVRAAYQQVRDELLSLRGSTGHWIGRLSDSALSTATAISALSLVLRANVTDEPTSARCQAVIDRGIAWLVTQQNGDGGWGDTDRSHSNLATTMLVRAAFHLARREESFARREEAARYVKSHGERQGLARRYGRDKTFAVPILTNCALAGLADWRHVAALPFELACFPYPLLRLLRLPVVSYAVPALVAIGQARYFHRPPWDPFRRALRAAAVSKSLGVLQAMQPESGGYLEATPLTSFVVMSLAGTGRADHPVVRRGLEFLLASARPDGAWPIDTNLATWNTTLAIAALDSAGETFADTTCLEWLLQCQHRRLHPFTHASPGGWAWTDLSGGVPDADDTSGALLALAHFRAEQGLAHWHPQIDAAAEAGIAWLLALQNRDGGWPTFCRGWGRLPFDRSGVDLTAHVLRALAAWSSRLPGLAGRISKASTGGLQFLDRRQRADGAWIPLWFGNQLDPLEENPVYGTSRVLLAYRDLGKIGSRPASRALEWLAARVLDESSSDAAPLCGTEEKALSVEALLAAPAGSLPDRALWVALAGLLAAVASGGHREPSPIGLYFARLWYYERMYPLVFTASALGRAVRVLS